MKPKATQMEVMLLTGTSFSSKQIIDKMEDNRKNGLSEKEMLSEACWNGMLPDVLPELCQQIPEGKKIYLWEIQEAESFIELELGELNEERDRDTSINPYMFIPAQPLS